jgi:hypothetical protein
VAHSPQPRQLRCHVDASSSSRNRHPRDGSLRRPRRLLRAESSRRRARAQPSGRGFGQWSRTCRPNFAVGPTQLRAHAGAIRLICLGAGGFWLVDDGVEPSLDDILDLSGVQPRNPRTNASIAKATIENWPEDPSRFVVELVMVSIAHPCRSAAPLRGRSGRSRCG